MKFKLERPPAGIDSPTVTALLPRFSAPFAGRLAILTLRRRSPASVSLKAKSDCLKLYRWPSVAVIVLSAEVGGLLGRVLLIRMLCSALSSRPSLTVKVTCVFPSTVPLLNTSPVWVSWRAVIVWPAVTALPPAPSVNVPTDATGNDRIVTLASKSPSSSENGKEAGLKL